MTEVHGDDGEKDFLVTLPELTHWTGYSDRRLLQLAKEGVVIRQSRGRYVLRASVRNLLQRAHERQTVTSIDDLVLDF